MAAAGQVAAPRGAVVALASLLAGGCYHAQALREDDLVAELRRQDRLQPAAGAGHGGETVAGGGSGGDGLPVDQAVAQALASNPDLRAFRLERAVAENQVVSASALENPTLRLEFLHGELVNTTLPAGKNKPAPTWGYGVGLAWVPPQPVEWSAKRAQARARVTEVEQAIRQREWEIAADVRVAHATLAEVEAQILLAESALVVRRRIVDLVGKRVAAGASTRLELNLAELALVQAERDRDGLDAQRASAASALAWLIGQGSGGTIRVAPQASDVAVAGAGVGAGELQAFEDRALAARPGLRAAKARYAAREQSVRLAYAHRWPWFQLAAVPRYRHNNSSTYPDDWTWAVDISLPILNWNTGPIHVAEAERDKERGSYVAELAALRRDIALAVAEIETRQRLVKRYQDTVLPALANHDRLLEIAVASAQIDVVALLAAEDVVLRSRREYQKALLDYHRAWLALERAVGEPMKEIP
jgi:cobalt-zinc-cadmium efflux system outer membrane protein